MLKYVVCTVVLRGQYLTVPEESIHYHVVCLPGQSTQSIIGSASLYRPIENQYRHNGPQENKHTRPSRKSGCVIPDTKLVIEEIAPVLEEKERENRVSEPPLPVTNQHIHDHLQPPLAPTAQSTSPYRSPPRRRYYRSYLRQDLPNYTEAED